MTSILKQSDNFSLFDTSWLFASTDLIPISITKAEAPFATVTEVVKYYQPKQCISFKEIPVRWSYICIKSGHNKMGPIFHDPWVMAKKKFPLKQPCNLVSTLGGPVKESRSPSCLIQVEDAPGSHENKEIQKARFGAKTSAKTGHKEVATVKIHKLKKKWMELDGNWCVRICRAMYKYTKCLKNMCPFQVPIVCI